MWTAQAAASATGAVVPEMEKLAAWLPRALPSGDDAACIVHGDFRLDNLILAGVGGGGEGAGGGGGGGLRVAAVLDWELSTLGHPMVDLAYACMPYHLPHLPNSPITGFSADPAALGLPSEDEFLSTYVSALAGAGGNGVQCIGANGLPERWPFFMALSFFRAAAILQGAHRALAIRE